MKRSPPSWMNNLRLNNDWASRYLKSADFHASYAEQKRSEGNDTETSEVYDRLRTVFSETENEVHRRI